MLIEKLQPRIWDERRDLIVPGDYNTTLIFCVEHFIFLAKKAIADHGAFYVALSGGSTPKAIFERLTAPGYAEKIEWNKVHLFWSDERAVPKEHPESNYHMAMAAGLGKMAIPAGQIHRMCAEHEIEKSAVDYERMIKEVLHDKPFDLIMLGMGDDGHTASLFPHTEGLKVKERLVIANFLPDKNIWRMSFTYPLINTALNTVIYVLGSPKKHMLAEVLLSPDQFEKYPVQKVGTPLRHALFITDEAAAVELIERKNKNKSQ
jgi:6-phosphogluconolactonase